MHTKGERKGQALNKNKEDRKETKKRVRQKGKGQEGKTGEQLVLENNVNTDFGHGCN